MRFGGGGEAPCRGGKRRSGFRYCNTVGPCCPCSRLTGCAVAGRRVRYRRRRRGVCLRRHRVAPCHYFSVEGCPVIPKFVDRSRSGAALLHFSALHRNLGGPFTAGASSGSHCVRLSCDTSSDTRRLFGGSRVGDIGSWIGRGIDSRQELGGVDYEVEGLARRCWGYRTTGFRACFGRAP